MESKALKVIGVGDNVCDKYVRTGLMYPGGQALNFSVFARRLGIFSAYMGIFGEDALAAHIISVLDREGIEHSHCRQYRGENGFALVDFIDGDRVFLGSNKGGVAKTHPLKLSSNDLDYLRGFDLIHTSNNSHIDDELEKLASIHVRLSYDFSKSWNDPGRLRSICGLVDYSFLSCGSMPFCQISQLCETVRAYGCRIVVATMGGGGALLYDGYRFYRQEPLPINVVDTLGAGDSFAAAFLVTFEGFLQDSSAGWAIDSPCAERPVRAALGKAAQEAAKTCLEYGAFGYGIHFVPDR